MPLNCFENELHPGIFFNSGVYNESTNEIITGGVGNITVSKFVAVVVVAIIITIIIIIIKLIVLNYYY